MGLHNASSQQWPKLLLKFCQSGLKKKKKSFFKAVVKPDAWAKDIPHLNLLIKIIF